MAAIAVALLILAPPAARAGLHQAFTVVDDSGSGGLFGRGVIRFTVPSGNCVEGDCLALLDGIEISFGDSGFNAGDTWEIPGSDVEAAEWSIDLRSWQLSGSLLLLPKGDLAPLLSFDGSGGGSATNLASGVVSTLKSRPIPEPATLLLFLIGLAALGLRRRPRPSLPSPCRRAA